QECKKEVPVAPFVNNATVAVFPSVPAGFAAGAGISTAAALGIAGAGLAAGGIAVAASGGHDNTTPTTLPRRNTPNTTPATPPPPPGGHPPAREGGVTPPAARRAQARARPAEGVGPAHRDLRHVREQRPRRRPAHVLLRLRRRGRREQRRVRPDAF